MVMWTSAAFCSSTARFQTTKASCNGRSTASLVQLAMDLQPCLGYSSRSLIWMSTSMVNGLHYFWLIGVCVHLPKLQI